jgi:hypothetical protein
MNKANLNIHTVKTLTIGHREENCWQDIKIELDDGDTFTITLFSHAPIKVVGKD